MDAKTFTAIHRRLAELDRDRAAVEVKIEVCKAGITAATRELQQIVGEIECLLVEHLPEPEEDMAHVH
jgi:hypothetical protein